MTQKIIIGKFNVLGLNITICNHVFILNKIRENISKRRKLPVTPLASQTFVLAYFNSKITKVLNKYDYLLSDSIWVKRSVSFLHCLKESGRLRGSDLVHAVCNFSQQYGYKIFLYGTSIGTLQNLEKKLILKYPALKISGCYPSKFGKLSGKEKIRLIKRIRNLKTDILFVALGSPLQEIFSYDLLYGKIRYTEPLVIIPVGAAFDFISGSKPQAPVWMQKNGFEWLFRLVHEPARLWKRYLVYGTVFLFLVLKQKFSTGNKRL